MQTSICMKNGEKDTLSIIVTNFDGNVYRSVTIGAQVWLVENLKATSYSNSDAIPSVTGNTRSECISNRDILRL